MRSTASTPPSLPLFLPRLLRAAGLRTSGPLVALVALLCLLCLALALRSRASLAPQPLQSVRGWRALGPAPPSPADARFVHVTAFERQLSEELRLSPAAALACAAGAAQQSWQPASFAAAVAEPARYAAGAAARAAAALRSGGLPAPPAWKAAFPRFSPCPGMRRYGDAGDGGKWFCALPQAAPCVIYSLGSFGQLDFEEAMSAATPCEIRTYDCYNPPAAGTRLPPRVAVEKVCLGDDGEDARFASLPSLMRRSGHAALAALKMDIEGAEWNVIRSLYAVGLADWERSFAVLPQEISIEVHLFNFPEGEAPEKSFRRVDTAWQALLNLGYTIVSSEANPACVGCEEYTLVRLPRECWAEPPIDKLLEFA